MAPRRMPVLLLVSHQLLLAAVPGCKSDSERQRIACCDVLLITIDALRPDHLGLYGYERDTSPNLDALAARGTVFENALSPAPCTLPAVLQLLTGSLEHQPKKPRLAEYLQRAGFATAAIVSHHFFGTRARPRPAYARGFDHFDIQSEYRKDHVKMSARTATQVTDRAIAWLDAHERSGRAAPFFLWLHYFDPHDPYDAPKEHNRFSMPDPPPMDGDRRTRLLQVQTRGRPWQEAGHIFSPREVEHLRSLYDGEIHYVDAEIGRLLDAPVLRGRRDRGPRRLLIIVTADHGERLGENGRWDHCRSLHDLELRVPLIASFANGPLGSAKRAPGAVSTIDIVPTILDLIGEDHTAKQLDGVSLLTSPLDRQVCTVWQDEWVIQDRHWKLYVPKRGPVRLYRIDRDPGEQADLAGREVAKKKELLARLRKESQRYAGLERRTSRIVEELKAIGYIQ